MAGTRIETEFAALGADSVVRAFEQHDAALVRSTAAARQQSAVQSRQATLLRQLRDAEREEQQQLRQAAGIIERTTTAEERYDKEIQERKTHLAAGRLTQEQYNRAVGDSKRRLDGATGSTKSLTGSIFRTASAVTGVTGAVGALLSMARLLKAEFDNIVEKQKNAGDRSIGFEDALTETRFNVGKFLSPEEQRNAALKLARTGGITPTRAAKLLGTTATSTGIQNQDDLDLALSATAGVARIRPDLEDEDLAALGGAAGSLGKTFGLDVRESVGFINKVGQQSNIAELSKQVQSITPAIAGLKANGFTEGEAGSLLATITQKGFDTEGAKAFTGTVGFAGSLRTALGDREEFQNADGTFRAGDALDYLQANPDEAAAFFRGGKLSSGKKVPKAKTGKGQLSAFFEELVGLLPGDTQERFDAGVPIIGDFASGAQNYDDLLAANQENNVLSDLDRQFASSIESLQVTDSTAVAGIIRTRLPQLEQALGNSALGQRLSGISREFESGFGTDAAGATDTAVRQLQEFQTELDATGGDRATQVSGILQPLLEKMDNAAAVTRTRQAGDVTISTGSNYVPGSYTTAVEQVEEFLAPMADQEYAAYLRNRFESAATQSTRKDPRVAASEFIRNFELAKQPRARAGAVVADPTGEPAASGEVVDVLREILSANQTTADAVAGLNREPAAAQPFVPESVSNTEPSRVSALSAEGAGR